MEVAIEEINAKGGLLGRQLKIIYADTKSDIAYGATAAQDVIDKGAQMVVVTCDYDYRQRGRFGRGFDGADRLLDLRRRSQVRALRHRPQRLHHGDRRARPGGGAGRMGLQRQRLAHRLCAARHDHRVRRELRRFLQAALDRTGRRRRADRRGHVRRRGPADRQPDHPHQGAGQAARLHRARSFPPGGVERHAPAARGRRQPAAARLRILGRRLLAGRRCPTSATSSSSPMARCSATIRVPMSLRLHGQVQEEVRASVRSRRTPSPATA